MPSRNEILAELATELAESSESAILENRLFEQLRKISEQRGTNVIFYASAFLQKSDSVNIAIAPMDIHGFMATTHRMDCNKGLSLILHTPGGSPYAAESIVDYLHKKFHYVEVIVPYLAMSAGSMISLASDLIVMGRQSQLGPIDPIMVSRGKNHSARAIKEVFERARKDIEKDTGYAHLWAPFLHAMAPSLYLESLSALKYSESLVKKWMGKKMLKGENKKIKKVAAYFNASAKSSKGNKIHVHGQRIDVDELAILGLKTEALETKENKELQDAVLTAYHLVTILFERSTVTKMIANQCQKQWTVYR